MKDVCALRCSHTRSVYVIFKNVSTVKFSSSFETSSYLICAGSIGNLICNFLYIMWMSWEPSPVTDMPQVDAVADAK